jgi:hypothetical protein
MGAVLTNRYDMPICRYAEVFSEGVERMGTMLTNRYTDMPICQYAEVFSEAARDRTVLIIDMPICRYAGMPSVSEA